jgi:hypothetical protein
MIEIKVLATINNPRITKVNSVHRRARELPGPHDNWRWRTMPEVRLSFAKARQKEPAYATFRPEYLDTGHTDFSWLEHDRQVDVLRLFTGDIQQCPFFEENSMLEVLVPAGWVAILKSLVVSQVFHFDENGHAVTSNGEVGKYILPDLKAVLGLI